MTGTECQRGDDVGVGVEPRQRTPDLASVVQSQLTVLSPRRQVSHAGTQCQSTLVPARHNRVKLLNTNISTSPVEESFTKQILRDFSYLQLGANYGQNLCKCGR